MKKHNNNILLPTIGDYLAKNNDHSNITVKDINDIVETLSAYSSFSKDEAEVIVKELFQVIRNAMLDNIKVTLKDLGSFYIASPLTGNRTRVEALFKPTRTLTRKLNERRRQAG